MTKITNKKYESEKDDSMCKRKEKTHMTVIWAVTFRKIWHNASHLSVLGLKMSRFMPVDMGNVK